MEQPILNDTLPDTLGRLLYVALDDLVKCEDNPRYTIDMDYWVRAWGKSTTCSVCLGGAVLVESLGYDFRKLIDNGIGSTLFPEDLPQQSIRRKLRALNFLRSGCVESAILCLHGANEEDLLSDDLATATEAAYKDIRLARQHGINDTAMTEYNREDPSAFHEAMADLANRLKAAGL